MNASKDIEELIERHMNVAEPPELSKIKKDILDSLLRNISGVPPVFGATCLHAILFSIIRTIDNNGDKDRMQTLVSCLGVLTHAACAEDSSRLDSLAAVIHQHSAVFAATAAEELRKNSPELLKSMLKFMDQSVKSNDPSRN